MNRIKHILLLTLLLAIAMPGISAHAQTIPAPPKPPTGLMPHEQVEALKKAGTPPRTGPMPHEELEALQKAIKEGRIKPPALPKSGLMPHQLTPDAKTGKLTPGAKTPPPTREDLLKKALREAQERQKLQNAKPPAPPKKAPAGPGFLSLGPQVSSLRSIASLYFKPMDVFVGPDKEFQIALRLSNNTSSDPDKFEVTVAYDPEQLTYSGFDASPLKTYTKDLAKSVTITPIKDTLHITATLTKPFEKKQAEIMKLKFKSAAASGRTALRFLTPPEAPAAILSQDRNLLGQQNNRSRGLVNAAVHISSGDDYAVRQAPGSAPTLDLAAALPGEMPTQGADGQPWLAQTSTKPAAPVSIRLQAPRNPTLQAGQDFWVDLVLLNNSGAPLDALGATVRFNPSVLSVIDEDQGNWIKQGTNIWDGVFHEAYPFDFHKSNTVDNTQGVIDYQVAIHATPTPLPSGVFARIHFRALKSTPATTILLTRHDKTGAPITYAKGKGVDQLQATWNPASPPRVNLRILSAAPPTTNNPPTRPVTSAKK